MRIPKVVFILPVLVYALVMGYLWLKVKNAADDLVTSAAPFATIEYDSVHVSLLGDEVGLNRLRIMPLMSADEFRVDAVRLRVPHVGYFFSAGNDLKKGKMPEELGLSVAGLELDLGSELFSMLEQMQRQAAANEAGGGIDLAGLDAVGCGTVERFGFGVYHRMGIDRVRLDVSSTMGYDEVAQRIRVVMDVKSEGLHQFDAVMEFDSGPEVMGLMANNQLPQMKFNYTDTGLYRLRNAFCARMNSSSEAEYVDNHIRMLTQGLAVTLPEDALASYRKYMLEGGTVQLSIDPAPGLNPDTLDYYPPRDIIAMLGLDIAINGQSLGLSKLQWDEAAASSAKSDSGDTVAGEPDGSNSGVNTAIRPSARTRTSSAPSFQKVSVNSAARHINKVVKVVTKDGNSRKGVLEKVEEGRLYLNLKLVSGNMGYWVDRYSIKQLLVLQ